MYIRFTHTLGQELWQSIQVHAPKGQTQSDYLDEQLSKMNKDLLQPIRGYPLQKT